MSRTYREWLEYYKNVSKELIIDDVMHDNEEIERLNNIIDKALNKLEEIVLYDEYITIHTDFINDTKAILKGEDEE